MRFKQWEGMMYLSRVEIDSQNRRKTKDLTHVGAYHNWVEQSFPAEQVKAYAHENFGVLIPSKVSNIFFSSVPKNRI